MKTHFRLTLAIVLSAICFSANSQNLKKVETYYDPYTKTKIHEAYTTLPTPPYLIHGIYKEFDQYGNIEKEINFSNGKKHGVSKIYIGTGAAALTGQKEHLGKVLYITNYANDQLNGLDQKFDYKYGKQQLILQKTWVNGKLTKQETWYEDGKPESIAMENGLNINWYPNGKKTSEVNMKNGVEDGKVTEWYESGKVAFTGSFKQGKPTGEAFVYYENGTLRKQMNYDVTTSKDMHTIEYYPSGKPKWDRVVIENHYVTTTYDSLKGYKKTVQEWIDDPRSPDGKLLMHGKMEEYFETGETWMQMNYLNGNIDGWYRVFTKSGEILNEGQTSKGQKIGKWKFHYTEDWEDAYTKGDAAYYRIIDFGEGGLREWITTDYYITGEKQFEGTLVGENPDIIMGLAKYYYQNGQISETGSFSRGMRNGAWEFYHENGKLKAKGSFSNDKETGKWELFDEKGNLTETKTF